MKENQKNNTRLGWTDKEQALLQQLYETQKIRSWIQIAECMNKVNDGAQRSAKQCRERYNNFVKFKAQSKDSSEWTDQQNRILFDMYIRKGSKWVQIAKLMHPRSQNSIKNKFYGALRKLINSVNKTKNKSRKNIKPIKYQTIIKILQRINTIQQQSQVNRNIEKHQRDDLIFFQQIKNDILLAASSNPQNVSEQKAEEIIRKTHKFNILTRFQNMARNRGLKTKNKKILPKNSNNSKKQLIEMSRIFTNESKTSVDLFQQEKLEIDEQFFNLDIKQYGLLQPYSKHSNHQVNNSNTMDLQEELCLIIKKDYEPENFHFSFQE